MEIRKYMVADCESCLIYSMCNVFNSRTSLQVDVSAQSRMEGLVTRSLGVLVLEVYACPLRDLI